ncbi:MAG: hypothetical protein SNJ74_10375 [Fimbriimonadaceae bacterium]
MPPRSAEEVAEHLLALTLSLEQALHDDDLDAVRDLVAARDAALSELEGKDLTRQAQRTLAAVQDAETRSLGLLYDWRTQILDTITGRRMEIRRSDAYRSRANQGGAFDFSG